MVRLTIEVPSARYPVLIGHDLLPRLGELVREHAGAVSGIFIVTSPEVDRLWGDTARAGLQQQQGNIHIGSVHTLHVPAGEAHKRLATVETLCEQMAALHADRDSIVIALGGGVIGDISGFLAAVYMRGIRFVGVPTTLLAQVDSSVGGKTGVNLRAGKNLVGSFHHPSLVVADTATLQTLPARELRAGLQESVKAAILRDPELFRYLEEHTADLLRGDAAALQHVVTRSVAIKAEVVGADERESGLRMTLNLGHTLGHAMEAATHYTALLHGEAVGWGMMAAVRLAERRGAIAADDAERILKLIRRSGSLPRFEATAAELVRLTAGDKKQRSGTLNFVLPRAIGRVEMVRDVTAAELLAAAEAVLQESTAAGVTA